MSQSGNFSEAVAEWAERERSVQGLVLFGSQVRGKEDRTWSADEYSDWDFHIITSQPKMFLDSVWLRKVTDQELHAYAVRTPRLGSIPKVNVVLAGAEADFVIMPSRTIRAAKYAVALGLHHRTPRIHRSLQDLAIVIRPGWVFLKGAKTWEPFYRKVISEVQDPRLDDVKVRNLAEAFVCDYVWALRKWKRGELFAVQRVLHRELAETNIQLLHELKLRRGERSFPDARRLERVATEKELSDMFVRSMPDSTTLRDSIEKSAETLRELVRALLEDNWHWPKIRD